MSAPRRSESDLSDYEEADETYATFPTAADLNKLRCRLKKKCASVNEYLLSSRVSVDKRGMIGDTLQDLLSAFNSVAAAYERLKIRSQTIEELNSSLARTIRGEVISAFSSIKLPAPPSSGAPRSFADVTAKNLKSEGQRVKISNGPTVVVPDTISFVVGPKKESVAKFTSADDTRKAVMDAVNPAELNLKISRVVSTRNNAIRIIAKEADIQKIQSSPGLSAAGLEVKVRDKLNPRMVLRDVPSDLSNDDLLKQLISMNNSAGLKCDNVKIVYRYPPRENRIGSSVVIETSSDVRREILKQGRLYLSWQSCKVEDHLRVLQCYNCLSFGHLAKNCKSQQICGHCCSGSHNTNACPKNKDTPRCHNCTVAKLSNTDHRAFDAQKCQTIKLRLTEKAKHISY